MERDTDEEKAQPLIKPQDTLHVAVLPNNVSHEECRNCDDRLSSVDFKKGIPDEKNLTITISRDAIEMKDVTKKCNGMAPLWHSIKNKVTQKLSSCTCSLSCLKTALKSLFPILVWLPQYQVKNDLMNDIIAGLTVSILHIPQGMAYGMLASVEAVNGLYVSFFPLFIYLLMGTSQHMSVGTFAAVSLMVSGVTQRWSSNRGGLAFELSGVNASTQNSSKFYLPDTYFPTNIEIVTALCLMVGLCQLLLGSLRLGFFAVLLSDQLVSGFSTGTSVHVATIQIIDLLSVPVRRYTGPLKIVYIYIDIFTNIGHTNLVTILMSVVAIVILAVSKAYLSEPFQRKLKMPLPIDMIVLILATVVSALSQLNEKYDVRVMGAIPTGLPVPVAPRIELFPNLILDAIALSLVTFAVSMSLAKILGKKQKAQIRANQELLALGSANVFSSFFSCYPCSSSLSRSVVQERTGGKTQLASLVSCIMILMVLLVLGPLLYHLPRCILSAIILVALKELFLQVKNFWYYCKVSITDALIWMVTFLSVILLDLDTGLLAGIAFSILTVLGRSLMPHHAVLGGIPHTELYLEKCQSDLVEEIAGIKIFRFGGGVYFGNMDVFKRALQAAVTTEENEDSSKGEPIHYLIVDCSTISYIDISGLDTLIEQIEAFKNNGITTSLANCPVNVWKIMKRHEFQTKVPYVCAYPSVHDAVVHCSQASSYASSLD